VTSGSRYVKRIGGDGGLLYVYDPTWDEYAVLLTNVTDAAVDHAFATALTTDLHLSAQRFAALVAERQAAATPEVGCVGIWIRP